MSIKHQLKHSILNTLAHNQDGSYQTQANRKERLLLVAQQLATAGYRIRHINQLKFKHVTYLVNHWLQQQLKPSTIKNRMTDLRWIMKKHNKPTVIPSSNAKLNIPNRQYSTNQDKSLALTDGDLSKITDQNVKMSLLLQREFGLRREESIKVRINSAVVGDELQLKGSWCKNGKFRKIKIQSPQQWQVIEQVKKFIGNSQRALIPANKKYIQQQNAYDHQLQRAGIHKAHGLRHAYAQKRYRELTGFNCPAKGGPTWRELSSEQKRLDKIARQTISLSLGHERLDVLNVYCGK